MDTQVQGLISVCMIVKNEEAVLASCLQSVQNITNDIVIVDTGSTDSTVHIARSFGAKVLFAAWEHDFSKARNLALTEARNPWILSIDADEQLTNPEELLWTLQNTADSVGGILVNITSVSSKEGVETNYLSQLLRVFRNHPAITFQGAIHEQVIQAIKKWGWDFAPSNINIAHSGYNLSPEQMRAKQLRNLELLDNAIRKDSTDSYLLYNRSKTYLALGDIRSAERDIQQALTFAPPTGTVRPQALNYGGIIALQSGNYTVAKERATESLQLVPYQAFAHYVLAETYWNTNNIPLALQEYINVQDSQERNDATARIVGALELANDQLAFMIGRAYAKLEQIENAEQYFNAGLYINPKNVNCKIGLANCALKRLDFKKTRALLLNAQEIAPQRTDIKEFLQQTDALEAQQGAEQETKQDSTQTSTPLISLSMIVKNEEHTLRACLESVQGVVDEIVIVDTGSTDGTIELAREFGAKVYQTEWIGDFAHARNISLQHCTGSWVLYLDADERLDERTKHKIRPIVQSQSEHVGGVVCTLVSPHRQTDTQTEVHRGGYPRIFRNYGYPSIYFKGRVHEQISPSILENGGTIIQSDIMIHHTGYDADKKTLEQKVQRNYQLLIQHVQEEPLNAYAWFQLGQTLSRMQLLDKAQESLQFAYELGTLSTPVAATAASTLSHIAGARQDFLAALHWANQSLDKVPHQILASNYKAYALLYLGRLDEAEATFIDVLSMIDAKDEIPSAGFDIDLKKDVVLQGLKKIHELRSNSSVHV